MSLDIFDVTQRIGEIFMKFQRLLNYELRLFDEAFHDFFYLLSCENRKTLAIYAKLIRVKSQ